MGSTLYQLAFLFGKASGTPPFSEGGALDLTPIYTRLAEFFLLGSLCHLGLPRQKQLILGWQ